MASLSSAPSMEPNGKHVWRQQTCTAYAPRPGIAPDHEFPDPAESTAARRPSKDESQVSFGASLSAVELDLAQHDVDGREVKVEHPTKPNAGVICCALPVVVMTNTKIVCNVEQVFLVRARQ